MGCMFSDKWSGGQLICFSALDGQTDFANDLVMRIAFDGCALELKAPAGGGALVFDCTPPRSAELSCDFFLLETSSGTVRGAMADTYHCLIEGNCVVCGLADTYYFQRKDGKTLVGVKKFFDPALLELDMDELLAARRRRQENLPMPPAPEKAFFKAVSQLKGQINSPCGKLRRRWTTPDRWPHKKLWLWDSVFHAIGLRHFDIALARETLLAVFDQQREDGFIAHMASPDGISDITQPPVLAYGAAKLHETAPDADFLAEVYAGNARFLDWIAANRDPGGSGLAEWKNSDDINCRCDESGMDNSPRFDDCNKWKAVDLNAYLGLEYACMEKFAGYLGLPDAAKWRSRREKLNALLNQYLWDEAYGLYVDYDAENGKRSPIAASVGFLPLLSGAPTPEMAKKLVQTLNDPAHFGGAFPVSSISRSAEKFYKKDMWRGPTWININYLIIDGLEKYGFTTEAEKLRRRTLAEEEKQFERYGTFFEFYDDRGECDPPQLLRKSKCDPVDSPVFQVFFDYGWSASLYIDLFIRQANCGSCQAKQ